MKDEWRSVKVNLKKEKNVIFQAKLYILFLNKNKNRHVALNNAIQ